MLTIETIDYRDQVSKILEEVSSMLEENISNMRLSFMLRIVQVNRRMKKGCPYRGRKSGCGLFQDAEIRLATE